MNKKYLFLLVIPISILIIILFQIPTESIKSDNIIEKQYDSTELLIMNHYLFKEQNGIPETIIYNIYDGVESLPSFTSGYGSFNSTENFYIFTFVEYDKHLVNFNIDGVDDNCWPQDTPQHMECLMDYHLLKVEKENNRMKLLIMNHYLFKEQNGIPETIIQRTTGANETDPPTIFGVGSFNSTENFYTFSYSEWNNHLNYFGIDGVDDNCWPQESPQHMKCYNGIPLPEEELNIP